MEPKSWTAHRVRVLSSVMFLFVGFSIIFSVFTLQRIVFTSHLLDFSVYYKAVDKALDNQNPYIAPADEMAFIYPPTALLFLLPVHLFPYPVAEDLWTITSFLALILTLYILIKSVMKKVSLNLFLVLYSFSVLAFPTKFTLGMGQINLFILLLLSLVFYFYIIERSKLAAVFLAMAISLKVTPIVLLFFFWQKRKWNIIIYTVVFLLFVQLISDVVLQKTLIGYYASEVFPNIPTIGNSSYYNQALTGFLARAGISPILSTTINYASLLGLIVFSFHFSSAKKLKNDLELSQFGVWLLIILIAGGLTWQHHLVLSVIPYTGILLSMSNTSKFHNTRVSSILMLCISYFLFYSNIKQPNNQHTLALSHGLYAMLILLALSVIRTKEDVLI